MNRRRWGWVPLWAMALVALMAIGTVWLRLAIVRTTYQISESEQMIRQLQQVREDMDLKVTGLRSPRRLEALAKTRFDLLQPRSDQIIYFRGRFGGNDAQHSRRSR